MRKIKSETGLTVVEMLAAVLVLVLLSLMLGTGLNMVMHAYETVVAQSEVELLLSTAVDAIADDLRYAWNVKPDSSLGKTNFTYSSDSYGDRDKKNKEYEVWLDVVDDKIVARINGKADQQVLSINAGAYGSSKSYKEYSVDDMYIDYKQAENTFTIHLKVTDGSGITACTPKFENQTAEGAGITVRCLNPALPSTTGGSP